MAGLGRSSIRLGPRRRARRGRPRARDHALSVGRNASRLPARRPAPLRARGHLRRLERHVRRQRAALRGDVAGRPRDCRARVGGRARCRARARLACGVRGALRAARHGRRLGRDARRVHDPQPRVPGRARRGSARPPSSAARGVSPGAPPAPGPREPHEGRDGARGPHHHGEPHVRARDPHAGERVRSRRSSARARPSPRGDSRTASRLASTLAPTMRSPVATTSPRLQPVEPSARWRWPPRSAWTRGRGRSSAA